MVIWNFGNTTVRSPFRLRNGLIAIYTGNLESKLRGEENEKNFIKQLAISEVIDLRGDVTYSVGRKWRSAMCQHGFLYPKLEKEYKKRQDELGPEDTITPNGFRLLRSETVLAWNECFLRSLAAFFIPSYLTPKEGVQYFSPLRFVLQLMLLLEEKTGDSTITFFEMASVVQCNCSSDGMESILFEILSSREKKEDSKNKRQFDQKIYSKLASEYGIVEQTFRDYADVNIRYLKATGLFYSRGKGISLSDEKKILIKKLISDNIQYGNDLDYLKRLSKGAELPFDKKDDALIVLNDLVEKLKSKGEKVDISRANLSTPAEISMVRYEIEERLSQYYEIEYANNQVSQINEILEYLNLLISNKYKKENDDGSTLEIPKSERPAYFEWIIWRAFLAINSLVNKPWEARKFKVDHDFLPVCTAPGGDSDLIFEFSDMVLVVEVTLTSSSRQEATEGEPVRRHVADYAEQYSDSSKRVFGLFITINIDTNTANTFRLGEWYLKDDKKINLHIIPISLSAFGALLSAHKTNLPILKSIIRDLLIECRAESNKDAPEWKKEIDRLIQNRIFS